METQWKQNSAKQTRLWLWALSAHCLTSYWSASSALAVTHVWFPSDTITVVGLFSCLGDGFPAQLPLRNSVNGNCYLFTCNTAGRDCDCGPILTMRSMCARSVLRHNYFQYLITDPNQQKGQSVRPDSFAPLTSKQTAGAVFLRIITHILFKETEECSCLLLRKHSRHTHALLVDSNPKPHFIL